MKKNIYKYIIEYKSNQNCVTESGVPYSKIITHREVFDTREEAETYRHTLEEKSSGDVYDIIIKQDFCSF